MAADSLASSSVGKTRATTAKREQRSLDLDRARAAFDRFNQTNDPGDLTGLGRLIARPGLVSDLGHDRTPDRSI